MALYRIAENGTSIFHIVTHRYADETVRYAASELQKYILTATGTDIPYFSDRCPMRGPEIRIGSHVRDMVDSVLPPEGFRIREDGTHVYIEGGSSRGVLYGVYHFLNRYCGFAVSQKMQKLSKKQIFWMWKSLTNRTLLHLNIAKPISDMHLTGISVQKTV